MDRSRSDNLSQHSRSEYEILQEMEQFKLAICPECKNYDRPRDQVLIPCGKSN
jgi:hypothetical protein